MAIMPKKYPVDVKDGAVRIVRERAGDYGSIAAACVVVGGQLGIAHETLRGWAK
jgi:transposase